MASLDVESLFTNIPIDETIKNAVDNLFSNNMYQGKLSKSDLYYHLKLPTFELSYIFDNILYKQIDGVSMGLPLGPTLANAFLCHYEKLWLDNCPSDFKPLVYRRYVDDIFVLSPNITCYRSLEIWTLDIEILSLHLILNKIIAFLF